MIHEASPAQSIVAMAASNFGVGWIASRHQQFPRRGVVYREIVPETPKLTLGVAFNKGDTSSNVKRFLAIAKRMGRSVA
jgi:DNA-binding transcriptional LysR family regulator